MTVDTRHYVSVQTRRWRSTRRAPGAKRGHREATRPRRLIRRASVELSGVATTGRPRCEGPGRVAGSAAPSQCCCELKTALKKQSH